MKLVVFSAPSGSGKSTIINYLLEKGINAEFSTKTMQSKLVDGLYFAGEILNIDAYTGGFNLQNCWSTAFIVAQALN